MRLITISRPLGGGMFLAAFFADRVQPIDLPQSVT
jgi:hypothetical protein